MKSRKAGLQLALVLLGLVVFVLAFYFGNYRLKDKLHALENNNNALAAEANIYSVIYNNMSTYTEATADYKEKIAQMETEFSYGMSTQDEIMYMSDFEKNNAVEGLFLNYINLSEGVVNEFAPEVEYDPAFATGVVEKPYVADDGLLLVGYPISYGYSVSYKGFKDMVTYLNKVGTKAGITGANLAFDSTTGNLNGNMEVILYVLSGTENQYTPLQIPNVSTGVENIFGTVDIPVEVGMIEIEDGTEEVSQ